MDTGLLKGFAAGARVDLIKEVGARLDVVLASGSVARAEAPESVAALERAVGKDGREAVVDRVAYTWFNRIIALRFMDANGYTGVGVVSPEPGKTAGQPQVLSDAKGGDFDADVVSVKTQATVTALLNDTRPSTDPQGEAYGLLLEAYCRFWNKAMPFMFEREGDYTELLMPTALLAADSVRDRAVRTLTDEVCGEVEVIGWLYQFYISERKDEVFAGFKKNKKAGAAEIPAATQLFTPHWIVRYLVENSLGRLWLLNHPESQLAEQMDYYIPPVDEETDFLRVSSPEELKVVDPAIGSGHMLTYAFDLLYAIYEEQAYSPSEIPSKILEHNLYGAEIDPRAGALAAFALTMKAAKKRKLFLKKPVQPHVCVLENVRFEQADLDYLWSLTSGSVVRSDADGFWNAFEHADTFGSLIQPNEALIPVLKPVVEQLETTGNLLATPARRVLDQAEQLSTRYHVVVANPPYMGTKNMSPVLRSYLESTYPSFTADLFSAFISRCFVLARRLGRVAMIAPNVWLTLKGHSGVRDLLSRRALWSLLDVSTSLFEAVSVATGAWVATNGPAVLPTRFVDLSMSSSDVLGRLAHLPAGVGLPLALEAEGIESFSHLPSQFTRIDGEPFVYRLTDDEIGLFSRFPPLGDLVEARVAMATADNDRFLRGWYEVASSRTCRDAGDVKAALASTKRWFPVNRGGEARAWYWNRDSVIDWEDDGRRIRQNIDPKTGRVRSHNYNGPFAFREGLTWGAFGSGLRMRYTPAGSLFVTPGSSMFGRSAHLDMRSILVLANSALATRLSRAVSGTINLEVGDVLRVPVPNLPEQVALLGADCIDICKSLWDMRETSMDFRSSPLLGDHEPKLVGAVESVQALVGGLRDDLHDAERAASELVDDAAGVSSPAAFLTSITIPSPSSLISDLVSYAVGCMFGRYSLDEPGLVLANEGDSLQEYLEKVPSPSFMPDADGVIPVVDGEWFEDDIVATFRQFLRVAFGEEHFEENLKFVIDSFGVKDLRDYFVKSFYKDHVQRYKKRPIYWMFSSPKGSFNALVYLHRYTPSTVSTVLNEYLREFIKKLEVSLEQQERMIVSGANAREVAAAQKEAERLRKVLIELGDYERALYDLASHQIDLDLDDGVLVNYQKFGAALKDVGLKKSGDSA
ncbi:BREX-1 system adenine-specific DNA-methyltransferase PglX [Agromyces sp. SYSU T00194]|uniref:BREX-1 system adenine-specific DNA-methyltransferase PglX n=1 Tax=Agromyces chitinivorans TaxID=3158560 RepID=UPI003399CA37